MSGSGGAPRAVRAVRGGRGVVLRAWAIFLVSLGGLMLLLQWNDRFVGDELVRWNAGVVAGVLRLLGRNAGTEGGLVFSDVGSIQVIGECTASHVLVIFVAAVLAFPCGLRPKLVGIGAGVPAILLLNVVRLVSLVFIGGWYPRALDVAHWLVWQSLLVFATVLLWLLWASFLTGSGDDVSPT